MGIEIEITASDAVSEFRISDRWLNSRKTNSAMERLKVCEDCQEYPSFQPPLTEDNRRYWPFSGCCRYRSDWYGDTDSEVESNINRELYDCPQCLHVWNRVVKNLPQEKAPLKACVHCLNLACVYVNYWRLFRKQEDCREEDDVEPGFDCDLCAHYPAPKSYPTRSLCRYCKARDTDAQAEMEHHLRGCRRCRYIMRDIQGDPALKAACEPCGYLFRGYVDYYARYGLRQQDVQTTPCNPEDCRMCFHRLKHRAFSREEVAELCSQCAREIGV